MTEETGAGFRGPGVGDSGMCRYRIACMPGMHGSAMGFAPSVCEVVEWSWVCVCGCATGVQDQMELQTCWMTILGWGHCLSPGGLGPTFWEER